MDPEYWYTRISLTGINIILAWSVYASYLTGTVSLGQVAFYAIGAFASASFTMILGWDIVPAILAGALIGACVGVLIAFPTLRLRGFSLTIATLAFAEVTRVVLYNIRYGREGVFALGGQQAEQRRWIGPDGNLGFDYITYLRDNDITNLQFAGWVVLTVIVFGVFFFFFERSRLGYAMRAVAEDETAARSIGLHHNTLKVLGFTLGAGVASIAGGLHAHLFTYLRANDFGITMAIVALAYVVIGGGQTFWGPALAALILTFLPEATQFTKDYQVAIFGAFIMLTMIFRPSGIVTKGMICRTGRALNWAFGRKA